MSEAAAEFLFIPAVLTSSVTVIGDRASEEVTAPKEALRVGPSSGKASALEKGEEISNLSVFAK